MKIVLIIITWMGAAMPHTNVIETRSMKDCERLKHRIEMSWINAGIPDGFEYIMECQEVVAPPEELTIPDEDSHSHG